MTSRHVDLALVYPPWPVLDDRAFLQNSLPPLGILSIASYMDSLGYRVVVYDVHGEKLSEMELRERLRRDQPRVVGISVLTNMCIPAHKIAKVCKEEVPTCRVIAGGVHAEALPERMLRNSAIDAVARGDGEETVREIMGGLPFSQILGLSYREGSTIRHNELRPVEMNLDKYPFPAYSLVNFKHYFPAVGSYRNLPAINMLMTRGCPGKCTFCNSAETVLRSRGPEKMVEQIRYLRSAHGIRQIQFYDDTFTVMKKPCLEFCRLLATADIGVTWMAYIRGDCFSDELAGAMKMAGCHQVLMGVETGSDVIARRIGKPIDRERYRQAVRIAHRHGMEVRGSFIIGNMDETWKTMEETMRFAIELDIDLFQLSISTPYPGTALYKEAVERGMLRSTDWYHYGQGEVLVDQPQITEDEIYRFERYAFRSFYLRPKTIARMIKRIANIRHVRDYVHSATILLLGLSRNKHDGSWDCWKNLREDDFLDIEIASQERLRLTHQLRQEVMLS